MYADDTSLMCKTENVDDLKVQLESNLKVVANWFKAYKLTLNVSKRIGVVKGRNGRQKTCEIFHVYYIFYFGFMCQITVIFGIKKDGSLVLNPLAS